MLKWFNAKCKLTNLDLSNNKKRKHKIEEPMIGRTTIAVFAHFLSKKTLPNLMPRAKQCLMSILSFSRSISFWEILFWATDSLKDLKTYHQFVKFLKLVIFLQNAPLYTYEEFGDCFDEDLVNFYRNNCSDCSDFEELKETIGSVEVKNNLGFKISKFTLQIYVFVYQMLMDLPSGRFDFEALTT